MYIYNECVIIVEQRIIYFLKIFLEIHFKYLLKNIFFGMGTLHEY